MFSRRWAFFVALVTLLVAAAWPAEAQVCTSLPTPVNFSPADGAAGVSLTPTLELMAMLVLPPCKWDATVWTVKEESSGIDVFSTGDDQVNLGRITIPAGKLQPGKTYRWTALIVSFSTGPQGSRVNSSWSTFTRFTTQDGGGGQVCTELPTPINLSPADGATGVSLTLTLELMAMVVFPPCTWTLTGFEVAEDAGFLKKVLYEPKRGTSLTRATVPAGILQPDKIYWWRAFIRSENLGGIVDSAWSTPTSFTTQSGGGGQVCTSLPTPVNTSPTDGATGVSLTPTLELTAPPILPPCTWDGIGLTVALDPGFNNIVGVGDFPGHFAIIPAGALLLPSTTYWWKALAVSVGTGPGGANVYSNWSTPTSFTTQAGGSSQFCTGLPTPVNASPPDGATGVSLTPTLEIMAVFTLPPCTWDITVFQIAEDAAFFSKVFSAEVRGEKLNVPAGVLRPGTRYWWRAGGLSTGTGQGGADVLASLSTPTSFTTQGGGARLLQHKGF